MAEIESWLTVLQRHMQTAHERSYGKVLSPEDGAVVQEGKAEQGLLGIPSQSRLFCTVHVRETETADLIDLLSALDEDKEYVGTKTAPKDVVKNAQENAKQNTSASANAFWVAFLETLFKANANTRKKNRQAIKVVTDQARDASTEKELAALAPDDPAVVLNCKRTVSKWRKFQKRGLKSAQAREKTLARMQTTKNNNKQVNEIKQRFQDADCDKYNLLGIQPLFTKTFGKKKQASQAGASPPLLLGMDDPVYQQAQSSDEVDTKQGTVSVYCLETKLDARPGTKPGTYTGGLKLVFRGADINTIQLELNSLFGDQFALDRASSMVTKCHYQQVGFKADPLPSQMDNFDRYITNVFEQATLAERGYATAMNVAKGTVVPYAQQYTALRDDGAPSSVTDQKSFQTAVSSEFMDVFLRQRYVGDPTRPSLAVQVGQTSQRQMYVDVWRRTAVASSKKKKLTKKDYARASVVFRRSRSGDPLTFRVQHALTMQEAKALASGVYQVLVMHRGKPSKESMYGVAEALRKKQEMDDNTPQPVTAEARKARQDQQTEDDKYFAGFITKLCECLIYEFIGELGELEIDDGLLGGGALNDNEIGELGELEIDDGGLNDNEIGELGDLIDDGLLGGGALNDNEIGELGELELNDNEIGEHSDEEYKLPRELKESDLGLNEDELSRTEVYVIINYCTTVDGEQPKPTS